MKEKKEKKILPARRFWFLSDTHFGKKSKSMNLESIQEKYFNKFFIPLLNKYKQEGDAIFFLGDLLDDAKNIDLKDIFFTRKILESIKNLGLPIYGLVGNHDKYYKDNCEINTLNLFCEYFTEIFSAEEVVEIDNENKDEILILPNGIKLSKLKLLEHKNLNCILAHDEISEYFYYDGMQKRNIKLKNPPIPIENVKCNLFSGHIHAFQEKENRIFYVGSPYYISRAESGTDKFILLYDISERKVTKYQNRKTPFFVKTDLDTVIKTDLKDLEKTFTNNMIDIEYVNNLNNYLEILEKLNKFKSSEKFKELSKISESINFKSVFNTEDEKNLEENIKKNSNNNLNVKTMFDNFMDFIDTLKEDYFIEHKENIQKQIKNYIENL